MGSSPLPHGYIEARPSFKIEYRRGKKLVWIMLYNKSLITWKSRMQKTTALSSAEAEYYSAASAGCEVLYLRALLDSLGFEQESYH
jgi:hypothetical protein